MSRRSLQASPEGMKKAQAALIRNSLTQQALAEELSISRQPVSKFFQGKAVDRYIFVTICEKLGLEWDEIASVSSLPADDAASTSEIESLVKTAREKIHNSIARRCGVVRLLDQEQPIRLDGIYTHVNVLERVTGRRRLSIAQLHDCCQQQNCERFDLSNIYQKRVTALEAVERYDKLMIWGKPGSGKTTFLKWLAIQCNLGQFRGERLPIFISLKEFAEASGQPSLLDYITAQFEECGVVEPQAVQTLLSQGRVILLLDGLDEVRQANLQRVLQEIRVISTRFFANSIVITCRIAAQEYTFEQFTEVEVADFDDQQIASFAAKCFQGEGSVKAQRFVQKLQEHQSLKELATNPLLLSLLCLVFEETDFAASCCQLYEEGLDLLLRKWDAKRGIKRNQVYKQSRQDKEDLLSQIAWTTFERGEYFFKQFAIEPRISHSIHTFPEGSTFLETLQVDSEDIFKSIEAQHGLLVERARGIYSFSHIIFQEYFAAKKIVSSPPHQAQEALQNLVRHMAEKRWREVFLLAVEMLPNADDLLQLMKRQLDTLASDEKQYEEAKKLLIDCLNSDCYLTSSPP
ncbi:putative signal transduction protein with Nacht domain [Scytonema sp. HK-05]|uniref:NACHT domain-containing protein n=1 Tax=Scytonema sp. HK-05 TaxID=1137095 RepID=UPI000936EA45|nr:NACHT domain-containing protein [Scytonema sp. HK-05]OKH61074.1 transcriptional regulator [Scytonema sp. HK-05]BAY46475.1 putative signal transduction protein with Nacht domain [Scytonema sp. HK-05]